jgi:hypothetical protein
VCDLGLNFCAWLTDDEPPVIWWALLSSRFGVNVSYFWCFFCKKLMCWCSIWLVIVVPLVEMKGTTTPSCIEHRHISSMVVASVFVLRWYSTPWTSDMVLNFLLMCMVNWESVTPAFVRLINGGWPSVIWLFLRAYSLAKVVLFCLPGPLLFLSPCDLFTFLPVFPRLMWLAQNVDWSVTLSMSDIFTVHIVGCP